MSVKPVVSRDRANKDVEDAITYYLNDSAEQAALGLVDALQKTYTLLGRHPGAGSPRYAHELNLPGLRSLPLTRYPYLVFYLEREDCIDVWRVLHNRRDIPELMQEPIT